MPVKERLRGEVKSREEALEYYLSSRIFGLKRPCQDPQDFGDVATVGKQLKRRGLIFPEFELGLDFGMYLGQHDTQYVVGIWGLLLDEGLIAAEVFADLSHLKQAWELD